jgi:hypothetical protein
MGMSPASFAVSELIEIVRRCNPNLDAIRAITWQATGPLEASWAQWLDGVFEPTSSKEIILLDVELDRNLEAWTRGKSVEAGALFLQHVSLRAERLMVKLHEAIGNGVASGHFATLYGVRCGTFSIPARSAILSYVLQELVAGGPVDIRPVKYLEAAVESVNGFLRLSSGGVNESLRIHG